LYALTLTSPVIDVSPLVTSQLFVFWSLSFLVLQLYLRPYHLSKDNLFEKLSLTALVLTSLFQTGRSEEETLSIGVQVLLTLITLCVLVSFVFLEVYTKLPPKMRSTVPHRVVQTMAALGVSHVQQAEAAPDDEGGEMEEVKTIKQDAADENATWRTSVGLDARGAPAAPSSGSLNSPKYPTRASRKVSPFPSPTPESRGVQDTAAIELTALDISSVVDEETADPESTDPISTKVDPNPRVTLHSAERSSQAFLEAQLVKLQKVNDDATAATSD
jgi:hypothetical protein